MTDAKPSGKCDGFALLIVLWTLVLVSLLFATLVSAGRSELRLTDNLRRAAALENIADGTISQTIFALLRPGTRGFVGNTVRDVAAPGAVVRVVAANQAGFVNPNTAPAPLLASLLVRLGAEPHAAARVAAAIVDWRTPGQAPSPGGAKAPQYRAAGVDYGPPGAPFETIGELRHVLGMTPGMLALLTPHLTLFWDGPPDPVHADPIVRAALADVGVRSVNGASAAEAEVVTITATADDGHGARVVRRAAIRLGFAPDGRFWRVLAWGNGG
jgi:general secretion pathway protein K